MSSSLFDRPESGAIHTASEWLTFTIAGTLAATLCVLAVALVGFMLLAGRVAVRDGVRVVIGCFILLGAPSIAVELHRSAGGSSSGGLSQPSLGTPPPAPPTLP